jgi:hypothetical protein
MKKIKALCKRFFKRNTGEKVLRAYNREKREAYIRQNEVMYWLYDITRYSPLNK